MTLVVLLICIAIVGGGIYLWLRRERAGALKRHKKLVEDAALLDQDGNLTVSINSAPANAGEPQAPTPAGTVPGANDEAEAAATNSGAVTASPSASSASPSAPAPAPAPAPLIRDLPDIEAAAQAFIVAWRESSDLLRRQETSERELSLMRYTLESAVYVSKLRDAGKLEEYWNGIYQPLTVRGTMQRNLAEVEHLLPTSARQTKAAWEALVDALRPYKEETVEAAYKAGKLDLASAKVILAAHKLRSVSKSSVESLLEKEAKILKEHKGRAPLGPPPMTVEKAEGDILTALEKSIASLKNTGLSAAQTYLDLLTCVLKLKEKVGLFETLDNTRVLKPQKPTQEEVMRYLLDIEGNERKRLTAEREAVLLLAECKRLSASLSLSLDLMTGSMRQHEQLLNDTGNPLYTSAHDAAKLIYETLKTWRESTDKELLQMNRDEKKPWRHNAPVATLSPQDADELKALRALTRTVGFAVAQAFVATQKLNSVTNDEPSSPYAPRVDREEDFTRVTARFDEYLKKVTVHTGEKHKWQSQVEVVGQALAARSIKVVESSKILETKARALAKSMKAETADELHITVCAAMTMVELNKEYDKAA